MARQAELQMKVTQPYGQDRILIYYLVPVCETFYQSAGWSAVQPINFSKSANYLADSDSLKPKRFQAQRRVRFNLFEKSV
jgi:hypothetical protein